MTVAGTVAVRAARPQDAEAIAAVYDQGIAERAEA